MSWPWLINHQMDPKLWALDDPQPITTFHVMWFVGNEYFDSIHHSIKVFSDIMHVYMRCIILVWTIQAISISSC